METRRGLGAMATRQKRQLPQSHEGVMVTQGTRVLLSVRALSEWVSEIPGPPLYQSSCTLLDPTSCEPHGGCLTDPTTNRSFPRITPPAKGPFHEASLRCPAPSQLSGTCDGHFFRFRTSSPASATPSRQPHLERAHHRGNLAVLSSEVELQLCH